MKIICIFAADNLEEKGGLYAMRYQHDSPDEYERLFDFWNDQEQVFQYIQQNQEYVTEGYLKDISTYALQQTITEEAAFLEDYFIQLAENDFKHSSNILQELFKPLDNREYQYYNLQQQKAQVAGRAFKKRILRLYAIRIHSNLFIITGGAIKLTYQMKDHPDTNNELIKINRVRNFLKENNISTADDLIYYYDDTE